MKGSPHIAAPRRRTAAGLGAAILAITSMSAAMLPADAAPPHPSSVIHDWERTAIRTIYTQAGTNIPVGVLYLGFTSLAVKDAVGTSIRHPRSSEQAAAAVAAHDVLAEYFPAQRPALAAELSSSLGSLRGGPAKSTGIRIGAEAADEMIASRVGDGRGDTSVVYAKPSGPGVWQPAAGGAMLVPWLAYVDPLVVDEPVTVDGPDPLTSTAYAEDYNEVLLLGSETSTARSAYDTQTARFFNANVASQLAEGVLDRLDEKPIGIQATARLFAVMHGAMADSLINCWRLKYEVGFWRPFQAIAGAADDGNPLTTAEIGWKPLIGNPPYADYVSGHGCLTSPGLEAIRHTLGEQTPLVLHSSVTNTDRPYADLSSIEHEAFHARIWGGLHFRDAMDDAYLIGRDTARKVISELR